MDNQNPYHLAVSVGELLLNRHKELCLAESCTGGLVGHLITNVPGSSEYFLGGILAYSNQAKQDLLQVKQSTLLNHGAVSQETALEMAAGVCRLFSGQCPLDQLVGLSVTGIAGPGGGTVEKPVGLVWIGLSWSGGSFTWQHLWQGHREDNKWYSAQAALQHLIDTFG